ncbi:hypothetical protein VZT92_023037 [Zoarces viviparus]|uniref:Uncharacterized protein n=1 Tax=Zoarces viviparus TaxID=48416 RepID=A0AAW1E5C1_ZOAVI
MHCAFPVYLCPGSGGHGTERRRQETVENGRKSVRVGTTAKLTGHSLSALLRGGWWSRTLTVHRLERSWELLLSSRHLAPVRPAAACHFDRGPDLCSCTPPPSLHQCW